MLHQGLPEAVLEQHIPAAEREDAMNHLLVKHRLKVLQHTRDDSLVYQEVMVEEAAKYVTIHACALIR